MSNRRQRLREFLSLLDTWEALLRHFSFVESGLEAVRLNRRDVVELTISIWKGNVSRDISDLLFETQEETLVTLSLSKVCEINIDRHLGYEHRIAAILYDQPFNRGPRTEDGPKTIVEFMTLRESDRLERLGKFKPQFHHLLVETMDLRIDAIAGGFSVSFPGFETA